MTISIEAVERMLRAAGDAGINAEFPAFVARLLRRAAAAGLETEELAALIKVLRAAS
jgi:3-hydroxyisobutyrate dehydrogenase-like beta-hydroxyacid dehydrogenase